MVFLMNHWTQPAGTHLEATKAGFHMSLSCHAAAMEEATHTSRAALRPGTAAVLKISAGLDCEAVSPLSSGVMPGVCKFHAADHSVDTRVVPSRGLGGFLHCPAEDPERSRSTDTARQSLLPSLCWMLVM